jgi:acetyl esterase/lipase
MNADRIHPELRQAFKRFPSLPFHNRLFVALSGVLMKLIPAPQAGPGVTIENRKLNNAGVRIYRSEGALSGAGLLWMHGGGLIGGYPALDDFVCGAFARDLKLVIVSVKYRLAPAHKYPAAIDDCFEAWQWLQQSAHDIGVNPARIAVAGQSAGGGLAACLAQRILDSGGVLPAAQALLSSMLDDRTGARHEFDKIDYPLWTNRSNRAAWTWYLGQPAGQPEVPSYAAAARRKDLAGLPPTWISVGDIDLFYDENCRYAERLKEAGVPCQMHVSPQAPHGFERLVPNATLSRALLLSAYRFLGESLGLSLDPNCYSYGSKVGVDDNKRGQIK